MIVNNSVGQSYFDQLKKTSNYHFDNTHRDKPGEWFFEHGRFVGNWRDELVLAYQHTKEIRWQSISGDLKNIPQDEWNVERADRVRKQEQDIERGGGDPKMVLTDANTDLSGYPTFQRMINFFCLDQGRSRIHFQHTGQTFNMHIDTYQVGWPGVDPSKMIRFIVMLEDWEPGQFYMYGNCSYSHWCAGDFHSFSWQDVPHGTANASQHVRPSLIVTGVKTPRTEDILRSPWAEYII